MSVSFGEQKLRVRYILIGVGIAIAVILLSTCFLCGIVYLTTGVPYGLTPYILLAADAIGSFIGAYCCAALNKSRGLIVGFLCGFVVFTLMFILGLSTGESISLMTLWRLIVLTVFGILGGIKGVNKKERIRIK